jgi:HD-like signal output (HDOD) protein
VINSRKFQDEKQKKTTRQALTEILHKFKKGQIDIPVLSKIVQETENVVRKPNSSTKDLAKVIERDAGYLKRR